MHKPTKEELKRSRRTPKTKPKKVGDYTVTKKKDGTKVYTDGIATYEVRPKKKVSKVVKKVYAVIEVGNPVPVFIPNVAVFSVGIFDYEYAAEKYAKMWGKTARIVPATLTFSLPAPKQRK